MTIDMEQFLHTFYEESFEGLSAMESALLNVDVSHADPEAVNAIFRAAHSIKGGSATFGLTEVAEFTHVMEALLEEMRDGTRKLTKQSVDLLLNAVDCLREMLSAKQANDTLDTERVAEIQRLLEVELHGHSGQSPAAGSSSPRDSSSPSSPEETCWRIRFTPFPNMMSTGNDPLRMIRELANLGELQVCVNHSDLPPLEDYNPEECYLSWEITVRGPVERGQIEEVFTWVEDECELTIEPLAAEEPSKAEDRTRPDTTTREPVISPSNSATQAKTTKSKTGTESTSIRVSIDKIDALINMVGELVITQSMLNQLGEDFQIERLQKLQEGLAQLERNTRELQENVMRIRMLPISFAFNRFPRLVHDLMEKLGKKVRLRMTGEQTELDKTVMEKIGDPLVHLVRNAMDHGIEPPHQRREAGKPETGELHLNAYHQGGSIVIEVSDDGRGMNRERILEKARQKGLVPDTEALSDEQVLDLIFHPGFSTADEVSDVSGRGVGMDVVRRNIKDLGGTVEVRSTEGQGTVFTIRLPLTLAILDGQLIRVGAETYILPLVSIIESLQIRAGQVNVIGGEAEVYKLRDEYIPIIRLYEVFGIEPDSRDVVNALLVVVEGDGQRVGMLVDDLLGQQQVVIKSLEANYKRIEGLSGATILGDGTVALILDVPGLISFARKMGRSGVSGNAIEAA